MGAVMAHSDPRPQRHGTPCGGRGGGPTSASAWPAAHPPASRVPPSGAPRSTWLRLIHFLLGYKLESSSLVL